MENEILQKIQEQDQKLADIYRSIEKMRKYFLWTLVITIVTVVLPLLALAFIIPWLLKTLSSVYSL
ncbi:MAG TPA: hypothetical protein DCX32_00125 [Candidatus Moranbacteria bacterium]|nr:MAG: hypothetical protein UW95_C0015G0013 [Parcubacteria group bacterium GW2011_GWC1_45_14]HAV10943.1 hypothetical protein [Candidatus Moranbacteria bacterium]